MYHSFLFLFLEVLHLQYFSQQILNVKLLLVFYLNLMEHKSVSKSEQMESPVEREGLLDEGHRCGACHKVSDAKVRIIIKYNQE